MTTEIMTCEEFVEELIDDMMLDDKAALRCDRPHGIELRDIINDSTFDVEWTDQEAGLLNYNGDPVEVSDPENWDTVYNKFDLSQAEAWEELLDSGTVNKAAMVEEAIYTSVTWRFTDGSELELSDDTEYHVVN